jgi:hypothetical protein
MQPGMPGDNERLLLEGHDAHSVRHEAGVRQISANNEGGVRSSTARMLERVVGHVLPSSPRTSLLTNSKSRSFEAQRLTLDML